MKTVEVSDFRSEPKPPNRLTIYTSLRDVSVFTVMGGRLFTFKHMEETKVFKKIVRYFFLERNNNFLPSLGTILFAIMAERIKYGRVTEHIPNPRAKDKRELNSYQLISVLPLIANRLEKRIKELVIDYTKNAKVYQRAILYAIGWYLYGVEGTVVSLGYNGKDQLICKFVKKETVIIITEDFIVSDARLGIDRTQDDMQRDLIVKDASSISDTKAQMSLFKILNYLITSFSYNSLRPDDPIDTLEKILASVNEDGKLLPRKKMTLEEINAAVDDIKDDDVNDEKAVENIEHVSYTGNENCIEI